MPSFVSRLLAPFKPPVETLRHYNAHKLRKDLLAGMTISVVEVPQSMAYAIIAGVPPQYGLYTSVIQGSIGALLSSSEHMTTGPTNTQSLLVASAMHRLVDPTADPIRYLQLVFVLTLLKGLIQLAFAAAQMGSMVRYVSRSVIAGLVSGAGFLIFFGQLPAFLGIHSKVRTDLPGILGSIYRFVHYRAEVNFRSILIGLSVIAITVGMRSISKLLPGALTGVVFAAGVIWVMGWTDAAVPLIDPLPRGFPHFHVPHMGWVEAESLFGGALALAVIGMIESVAIAKSIASRTGEKIDPNQEFFAQGFKNSLSSFFQCIPGSGSFTRSALDFAAGAETRFAAVFNAIFVGCIFWFLADEARYIPRAALAGVLFVIAAGLVEWGYLPRVLKSSRPDALVCGITFAATLFVPLEYAIFIGVFLNIALYLRQASRLHVREMVQGQRDGPFQERELTDRGGGTQVMFLQVEGDLFFGVADELRDRLAHLSREGSGVRAVVFRLRRTHSIDSTALYVLEQFTRDMHARRRHVILCGVSPELTPVLRNFGLLELIGSENFFEGGLGVFASAKDALKRARQLVGVSIDIKSITDALDDESWAYEI
jgi:sulfate permease, SulP family